MTMKPPTPTWGGLNQRLHAIDQARRWQFDHPEPSEVYPIIVDLFIALNVTDEDLQLIQRIKAKHGET